MCLAFRLPQWKTGRTGLWHPAFPQLDLTENALGTGYDDLAELFGWIMAGGLVEAHNAWFERGIWNNICVPSCGWPVIPVQSWRCSAAKAAAHSLPRNLEDAVQAMHLPHSKDTEGERVMKKMAKPRKPKKADILAWGRRHAPCTHCGTTGKHKVGRAKATPCEHCSGLGFYRLRPLPPMPTLWHESVELLESLFAYCRCDVLAEEGLSDRIPDLTPAETHAYVMDQIINERGFRLDREGIAAALDLIAEEFADYNAELKDITGGAVERASQRQRMLAWLQEQEFPLSDTQGDTLDEVLARKESDDLPPWVKIPPPHVRRALELMRAMGRSSTAKYETMMDWICPDDRAHGGLLYHGAGTGRWSGAGIQPHNFPRGVIKIGDMERTWDVIKTRDRALIESTDYTFKEKPCPV